jgi:hypothetical protein
MLKLVQHLPILLQGFCMYVRQHLSQTVFGVVIGLIINYQAPFAEEINKSTPLHAFLSTRYVLPSPCLLSPKHSFVMWSMLPEGLIWRTALHKEKLQFRLIVEEIHEPFLRDAIAPVHVHAVEPLTQPQKVKTNVR